MSDRRIAPAEVLAAYEKTGLRPIARKYLDEDCGCGLTALALAEGAMCREDIDRRTLEKRPDTWSCLGVSGEYATGFIFGFDGRDTTDDLVRSYIEPWDPVGMVDGRACWEAVKHLAAEEERNG